MQHRVGVISDTHIPHFPALPQAIWQHFAGVELIIHAGDLSVLSVISELETIAPVVAVQGNVEYEEVIHKLPFKREIVVGHCSIGIMHILGVPKTHARMARFEFPNACCVVFGHSHIPYNQEHNGQLLFNPGSATDRRHQPTCSIGMLYIDDTAHTVRGEIIRLETKGHFTMPDTSNTTSITTPEGTELRIVRAPRGTTLSCKGWQQEAAMRMLMNNLDPDVAERPNDLVVYGGSGRAARSWAAYDTIVRSLQQLENNETLLVQSGKPVGIFRTHPDAPRVLIANSNLVPHWATWDEFRRLEALGLTMYGQMTAGSWIYIGSQGIVQGTYETFSEAAHKHFGSSLKGKFVLTAGLGGMGGAQPTPFKCCSMRPSRSSTLSDSSHSA